MHELTSQQEKVIVVGLDRQHQEADLTELKSLVETAGGEVVGELTQARNQPDRAYFIGTGKVEELKGAVAALEATLVIVDEELAPSQIRNLESKLDARVIDRTQLILDIFAQRARTHEAQLQVEIAQLHYHLPRLTGRGVEMSRLGAGIGTRGPGESKLEQDRRRIRERISQLRAEMEEVRKRRQLLRQGRRRRGYPLVALVGYTNAGKSTLLNRLTGAEVFADNMLFATLDPTSRALELPDGREIAMSDTVGFISRLPHRLVEAFHATLEEVQEADVLVHVVDASNTEMLQQMEAVDAVLKELKAHTKPCVIAYNKIDLVENTECWTPYSNGCPSVLISAATGQGLEELKARIGQNIPNLPKQVEYLVPYDRGEATGWLHRQGEVLNEEYVPNGVQVIVELTEQQISQVEKLYQLRPLKGDTPNNDEQ